MENFTNLNQSALLTVKPAVWYVDIVLNSILVITSLYLLLALTFHELKTRRKERFFNLSTEKRYGVLSKYTCILIALVSFLRQSLSFTSWWTDFYIVNLNLPISKIEVSCNALPSLYNLALLAGTTLVFLFLWFRQKIFYIHPSLKILGYRWIKFFSYGVIIIWFSFFLALFPSFFVLVRFHYIVKIGCVVDPETLDPHTYLAIAWVAMSILMQISLLFLFVYPILKRTSWRSQQNNKRSSEILMRRVKKAIILTSIAFATDLLTILINRFMSMENTRSPTFEFGFNLLINHLVTIACFDYWKQILWPWNLTSRKQSENSSRAFTPSTNAADLQFSQTK